MYIHNTYIHTYTAALVKPWSSKCLVNDPVLLAKTSARGLSISVASQKSRSPVAMGGSETHVKLRSKVSATRYALPGVGKPPDFLVPVNKFKIQNIVGQLLVELKEVPEGGYDYERISGEVVISRDTVKALYDSEGKIRTHGDLQGVSDEFGVVHVYIGKDSLHEEVDDIPCIDLTNIQTPRTP